MLPKFCLSQLQIPVLEEKLSPLWHASFHVLPYPVAKSVDACCCRAIKWLCHHGIVIKISWCNSWVCVCEPKWGGLFLLAGGVISLSCSEFVFLGFENMQLLCIYFFSPTTARMGPVPCPDARTPSRSFCKTVRIAWHELSSSYSQWVLLVLLIQSDYEYYIHILCCYLDSQALLLHLLSPLSAVCVRQLGVEWHSSFLGLLLPFILCSVKLIAMHLVNKRGFLDLKKKNQTHPQTDSTPYYFSVLDQDHCQC